MIQTKLRLLVALVLAVVTVVGFSSPASAEEGCLVTVAGIRVCGELLDQPLPEVVTVTVRPDPIRLPGPTETVTVRPPQATVTAPAQPQATKTETQTETRTETVTEPAPVGPSEMPDNRTATEPGETDTVTETTTVSPSETRQTPTEDATIEPESGDEDFTSPNIDFGDGNTTVAEVGIGLLTTLALVGFMLFVLYLGYILGYKDKEKKDTDFIRALLDSAKSRRH